MLEWIGAGICIAIGFYLMPIIISGVLIAGALVVSGVAWLLGIKR